MFKETLYLRLRPLFKAISLFFRETDEETGQAPFIRDRVDIKRWMILVVIALIPVLIVAVWNAGLYQSVYSRGSISFFNEYLDSRQNFSSWWHFITKERRYLLFFKEGFWIFFPLTLVTYFVGGIWEVLFACTRNKEISEGFLVTGILYVLILPPSIPYWMAALGISFGTIFAKELFGGSGMNIVNPALVSRAFLFFTFPAKMSGEIWLGRNSFSVRQNLIHINKQLNLPSLDGFTQATKLAEANISSDIKRIHVDAIAANLGVSKPGLLAQAESYFHKWKSFVVDGSGLGNLSASSLQDFVTSPLSEGGLGLSPSYFDEAYRFAKLQYGLGDNHPFRFFLGEQLGSLGETSTLACLIGALFLIYTKVASWRTMLSMGIAAYLTALFFEVGSKWIGYEGGAWNPAHFAFPAYKHLLLGGLAFGAVFMATDPVTSPILNGAKWIYGAFCGMVTILIRVINPAYPEGVMIAILLGNIVTPLLDYLGALKYQKRWRRRIEQAVSR